MVSEKNIVVVAPRVELGNENMNESMTLFVSLSLLHSTLGTVAIVSSQPSRSSRQS